MDRRIVLGTVAAVALATIGCGSSAKREIVAVEGKIAFAGGGKLPAGTTLLFNPSEGGVGTAFGKVNEDGSFTVSHSSGKTGAEVGKYIVQLPAPAGEDATFYKEIRKDFYDPGVLTAEITSGMAPLNFLVQKP